MDTPLTVSFCLILSNITKRWKVIAHQLSFYYCCVLLTCVLHSDSQQKPAKKEFSLLTTIQDVIRRVVLARFPVDRGVILARFPVEYVLVGFPEDKWYRWVPCGSCLV